MSEKSTTLQARLTAAEKRIVVKAARLRRLGFSAYLRVVLVPMAQREVDGAEQNVIALTPDEQLAFWRALEQPVELTPAQRKLARLMKGKG